MIKGRNINRSVFFHLSKTQYVTSQQVRGFAPTGIVECWNNGTLGSGIMQYWVNGKICVDDKIKTG
jgi:hypothetical protein